MLGFIGGGNMAGALIAGIKKKNTRAKIIVSDKRREQLEKLKTTYRVATTTENSEICKKADIIILAVKPQNLDDLLSEIKEHIEKRHIIVSIVAGVRTERIKSALNTDRVVRTMPNTPALVGEGMTVISPSKGVKKSELKEVVSIFNAVGKTLVLDESMMDIVTALSGSGPAFFAHFIGSMIEGAVRLGLTRKDAELLAVQTARGTASLLSTGISPDELKAMVTSPGGTTAEGLYILEGHAIRAAVMEALEAATARSMELSGGR
ncbi:MAG: pyrroline-5-carboxylate reductase [Nitrospirae bacterium]|nr:MAG: pyrroline-5-carboxylate reductase [Nitrospirota bacterium]